MPSIREKYFVNGIKAFLATLISLWVLDVMVNFSVIQELYLRHSFQAGVIDFFGLFLAEIQIAVAVVAVCWIVAGTASILAKSQDNTNHAVILLSSAVVALTVFMSVRNAWKFVTLDPVAAAMAAGAAGAGTWLVLHFKVREIVDRGTVGEIIQAVLYPSMIIGLTSQVIARLIEGRVDAAVLNAVVVAIAVASLTALVIFRTGFVRFVLRWLPVLAALVFAGHAVGSSSRYGANPDTRYRDPRYKRPTVILIVLDTVRADHLKRFGYPRDTMPALETWAENAVTAVRAVSPAGWTGPAHASFFSGLPVSLHGHHYGKSKNVFATDPVDNIAWLPRRLAQNGYYTVAVTANPFALPSDDIGFTRVLEPTRRPWDRMSLAGEVDRHIAVLRRISEKTRWRMFYVDAKRMVGIVEKSVPKGDGPVFLFVNFMDAHSPYNPPEEALELNGVRPDRAFCRYDDHRRLTAQWRRLPPSTQRSLNELYDGELRWIDLNLKALLAWIDERYEGEAVVIVTSDHGEELGEHGRVGHEFGLSQTLVHVPLFVKGPHLQPGQFDPVISTRSLYDYILLLANGETPDLTAIARPDSFGVVSERYPSGHSSEYLGGNGYDRPWVALFENDLKGVGPSQYGFELFGFDRTGFHREAALAMDSTDTSGLREKIDRYWETYRDRRPESSSGDDPEEMSDNLRSLGYIK